MAYNNRGNAYNDLGEHQRAIEDLNEAIRLDPKLAMAYNNRGISYGNLGEHQRAIEDYDEALRLERPSASTPSLPRPRTIGVIGHGLPH